MHHPGMIVWEFDTLPELYSMFILLYQLGWEVLPFWEHGGKFIIEAKEV